MFTFTENASLLPHNTFGMDVKAALLIEYQTTDDLRQVLSDERVRSLMEQERRAGRLPFWHIGAGSNLLFSGDYPGVILHCTQRGIRIAQSDNGVPLDYLGDEMDCYLEIDAGTPWDDVCAYCAENGLYGPENLSLIPGEAGAAAVQNIGAYGVEIKDLIEMVICWDVEQNCHHIFRGSEMGYGYRESRLKHTADKQRYIVTQILLRTQRLGQLKLEYKGLREALNTQPSTSLNSQLSALNYVREAVIRIREGKLPDPKRLGNAGSFFKNPVVENTLFESLLAQFPAMPHYTVDEGHTKIPAGWLIEQCGWKGKSLGKAGVYEKQSLVLVNRGGARPDEIVELCHAIVDDVKRRFGITITPEVNLI